MFWTNEYFLSLLSLVLLGVTGASLAQEVPERYSTLTVEVKPGANAQYEEFILAFKAAAEKTNSPLHWLVSQTEVGGSNNYIFHRPIASWRELETPVGAILRQAYNEREVQRLLGLEAASATSVHTAAYIARPDLSRPGPAIENVVAVNYIDIKVRYGMNQEFEDVARHVVEASAATTPNVHWEMRGPSFGADNT
jgi:hypothetical protein